MYLFQDIFSQMGMLSQCRTPIANVFKMKNLRTIMLCLFIGNYLCAMAQPKTVHLKAATPVFAELKDEISSEDVKEGQRIEFTVIDQVVSDNNTPLIATGATAYGRVKKLSEYEMEIEIQFVKSVTGKIVHLEGTLKGRRTRRQCCVIFNINTPITGRVKDNTDFLL
jgi:hypothetical protein